MYADERELLDFRTFSQSASVSKRVFDTLRRRDSQATAAFFSVCCGAA